MKSAIKQGQVKINENGEYVMDDNSTAPPIVPRSEKIPHNDPKPSSQKSVHFERKPKYEFRPRKFLFKKFELHYILQGAQQRHKRVKNRDGL
jgi:hypothetical protein